MQRWMIFRCLPERGRLSRWLPRQGGVESGIFQNSTFSSFPERTMRSNSMKMTAKRPITCTINMRSHDLHWMTVYSRSTRQVVKWELFRPTERIVFTCAAWTRKRGGAPFLVVMMSLTRTLNSNPVTVAAGQGISVGGLKRQAISA